MTDGFVLAAGAGEQLQSGMTLKVGAGQSPRWSVFETTVPPGFDVGAHLHRDAEEVFYILDGELDLLAFEPTQETCTDQDWTAWRSKTGSTVTRGGPGSLMFVPAGCPHAFTNPGSGPARMLFLVAPSGHELYLAELGQLLREAADTKAVAALRARWDIEQLTPLAWRSLAGPRPAR